MFTSSYKTLNIILFMSSDHAWMVTWHGCPVGHDAWFPHTLGAAIRGWFFDRAWGLPFVLVGEGGREGAAAGNDKDDDDQSGGGLDDKHVDLDNDEYDNGKPSVCVCYPLRVEHVPTLVQFHKEEGNARWAAGREKGWLEGALDANFFVPVAPPPSVEAVLERCSTTPSAMVAGRPSIVVYAVPVADVGSAWVKSCMMEDEASGADLMGAGMAADGSISWKRDDHCRLLMFGDRDAALRHSKRLRAYAANSNRRFRSLRVFTVRVCAPAPNNDEGDNVTKSSAAKIQANTPTVDVAEAVDDVRPAKRPRRDDDHET